jgi:hypothetical protein
MHVVHDGLRLHLLRDDEQHAGVLRLLLALEMAVAEFVRIRNRRNSHEFRCEARKRRHNPVYRRAVS